MDKYEWQGIVLAKQGLVTPMSLEEICRSLNGLQAQFQSYVHDGFQSRLSEADFRDNSWQDKLVRQWTIRGTVHAFLKEDIPLYHYEGSPFSDLRLDLPTRDGKVSAARRRYFFEVIMAALDEGSKTREELKAICRQHLISEDEEKSLFNAWGGLIRGMVNSGHIYQVYGERRFVRLEDFQPMSKAEAELEIARRYFSGFGPVSMADARYYFKTSKRDIEGWMAQLPLKEIQVEGEPRFYLGDLPQSLLPDALFIAGFDQLLLGYEKRQNPFFDPKHIRDIYTLTGIVKPTLFVNDRLVGTWRKDKGRLELSLFETLTPAERKILTQTKERFAVKMDLAL